MNRIIHVVAAAGLSLCQTQANAEGNITVELDNGVLSIVGDAESNDIIIREIGGFYFIGGNDLDYPRTYFRWLIPSFWDNYPPTTVNGVSEPMILDPDQTSEITDIVVIGGGGDENLLIMGSFTGSIHVDSGAGRDRVTFLAIEDEVTGDLSIDTGKDDDTVSIAWLLVHGNVDISTGHGVDRVFLSGLTLFLGDATINTGLHDDLLTAGGEDNYVAGNLLVQMGQGDDFVAGLFGFGGPQWEIDGSALFHGGQGYDPLPDTTDLIANPLEIVGFESP